MKDTMMTAYNQFSVATSYILGFIYNKVLYAIKVQHIAENLLTVEKASRSQGNNLRLRIRKNEKLDLLNAGAIAIGSESDLLDPVYNKGEVFERIVTERLGQNWVKDTIPFWVSGDVNIGNEKIQVKLDGATLLNTKTMEKLLKTH